MTGSRGLPGPDQGIAGGFDPSGVTGHPDHRQATLAALDAAAGLGLPVLGWTLPVDVAAALNAEYGAAFVGHPAQRVDVTAVVDRSGQLAAVRCHPSQAVPSSVMWRRLELLGDREHLRWLRGNPDVGRIRSAGCTAGR